MSSYVNVRALSTEIGDVKSRVWDLAWPVLGSSTTMRTLLAVALVAAVAPAASAGTYIGLGIGTGASISDSNNTTYAADGRSGRVALGFSFGRIAIEGAYSGFSASMGTSASGNFDSRTLQVAGKYNYPLGDNFEIFGRLGLIRTQLTPTLVTTDMTVTGDGYTLSAGVEYRLPSFGSIFVDYTRNHASFNETFDQPAIYDQTASMWTLGLNISL
jgi:outer membrane protein with beta-barrel domain